MSDWLDKQKQSSRNIRKLLQEWIEEANPRRKLTAEETKLLAKLDSITDKRKRRKNVLFILLTNL